MVGESESRISFSFDDGRSDNVKIIDELLLLNRIPVTLNITTGYVDGTCSNALLPSKKPAMTINDIQRLYKNNLVEIALHGDQHLNTINDILESKRKLSLWLECEPEKQFGFASPNSGFSSSMLKKAEYADLRHQIKYVRVSFRIKGHKYFRILCRKAGRVQHWPVLYRWAYSDTKMRYKDGQVVYSVPIMKDATVREITALVDYCIQTKASIVLMFHSIITNVDNEDNWSWQREKFDALCNYLLNKRKENLLKICSTEELYDHLQ